MAMYLRNHEAAAQAGLDLFRRVARTHRDAAYAADLKAITAQVHADLTSLQAIMHELGVSPDLVLATVLRIGERAGRWKPNGRLLRRSPLSDLLEIEALVDAVYAKLSGWRALDTVPAAQRTLRPVPVGMLIQRAESQLLQLHQIHHDIAEQLLNPPK